MGCSCSKPSASEPLHGHGLPTLLTAPLGGRKPLKRKGGLDVSCHASEGSKWHSELLAVSADLKEKLQDPQFVATRCDLDGSGDLDPHELKQAARVYGISFSGSSAENDDDGSVDLELLMDGQPRISKERFAEMVASQQRTTSIRTVPHSLRGMALGQLQHLETLFIKSGWLAAQCEAFNTENAQAIANGTKFRQNPNLYALDAFVVTPMSKPGTCKARENDKLQTIAEARGMSSFSELVNPCGLMVHCFVSHFWGHDFSSTVTALDLWAKANYHRITSEKESLVYWICLFALNQHKVAEEVGENPREGPFNAALAQATGGAVMVLDEEIRPFSRLWCLFEISRLKDLQQPFELICSEGSLSQPDICGNQAVSIEMLEVTCEALWNVSAAKAQSSVAADKYQIWSETANKCFRGNIDGLGAQHFFQSYMDRNGAKLLEGVISDFNNYIKSLLSTTMLQLLLARGQREAAAKCCVYGAQFGSEELMEICSSLQETDRKDWLNCLLMQASNASTAQLLLEHRADGAAASKEGVTALHEAAYHDHRAVAELLLEHHADARAADNSGVTALMGASHAGHVAVVELLLEHRADVRAARNDGRTALMAAAEGGHVSVAKLLLERGADVHPVDNDGTTARMWAVAGGHMAVAEFLKQHEAGRIRSLWRWLFR